MDRICDDIDGVELSTADRDRIQRWAEESGALARVLGITRSAVSLQAAKLGREKEKDQR